MASNTIGDAKEKAKDNAYNAYTIAPDKTNQAIDGAYGKARKLEML